MVVAENGCTHLEVTYRLCCPGNWVQRFYLETSRRRILRDTPGVSSKSKGLGPTLVAGVNKSRRTKNQLKSWSARLRLGLGSLSPIHLPHTCAGAQDCPSFSPESPCPRKPGTVGHHPSLSPAFFLHKVKALNKRPRRAFAFLIL